MSATIISSSGTKVTTEAEPRTILNLNIADECHQYSVVIARVVFVELLAILLDISKVSEVAEYVVAATIITAVLRWSVVTEWSEVIILVVECAALQYFKVAGPQDAVVLLQGVEGVVRH